MTRTTPGRLATLAALALTVIACGSGPGNTADRISAAAVEAAPDFVASVAAYTPDPIEWEYCVPPPVVADVDVQNFDTLPAAATKVTLQGDDRSGIVEVFVFDDPAVVVEVVDLYDWYLGSRRECLASNAEADRILNGATDDREFTPIDVTGADAAFATRFSNLSGQVAFVDIAVASTPDGVIVVSFTSEVGPTDVAVLREIVSASLAAS